MWYQLSQDDCYLLIGALNTFRNAKYDQLRYMPSLHEQITRDLEAASRLADKFYDDGLPGLPAGVPSSDVRF